MAYVTKSRAAILQQALRKVEQNTSLTGTGPGSVLRAITEAVTSEIADLYEVLDFNMTLQTVSTSQGRALDLLGSLYNITRKTLTEIATIDKRLGSFYFYVDSPAPSTIEIPVGTRIYTDSDSFIGETFQYQTTEPVTIPAGRTRAWASIAPLYSDSVFTAGINTLIAHNVSSSVLPNGVTLRCTNPKAISPQVSYEDDDSYRTRIVQAVRTSAGGTTQAVRFAALSVPGVRDVQVRNAAYGLGSFQVLIALDAGVTSAAVVSAVRTAIGDVRPVGSRMYIQEPRLIPIDVRATVLLSDIANLDREAISRRARIGILRYLNTLTIGTTLVYSQLLQYMMGSSDFIADVSIVEFKANGEDLLRRNYVPQPDEQLIPGSIVVTYST